MIEKEKIKNISRSIRDEIISIRHHLHAHPELSFQETETAKFISQKLSEWNIEHQTGIAGNGMVAIIKGKNHSEKVIALRADMDALPITEKNNVDYKSQNPGVMHACGHDVHSSSLLGTAKILNTLKSEFEGTIKLIFQPGEEKLPGGASLMIKEGVLENPKPDVIIAQHVYTPLRVGMAGFRPGKYMASADEIYITVKGKGGHAADPKQVINPIFVAAKLLMRLEKLIEELSVAEIPTVLAFGKIIGAGATNVIPDEVTIEGTVRTLDEDWRSAVHKKLEQLITGFSSEQKKEIILRIDKGYPSLINNEIITKKLKSFATDYLGKENVTDLDVRMASEDFAFFSQKIPSCLYRIGTGNPNRNIVSSVHTPTFDIDEDALEIASGLMAWLAVNLLIDGKQG